MPVGPTKASLLQGSTLGTQYIWVSDNIFVAIQFHIWQLSVQQSPRSNNFALWYLIVNDSQLAFR